MVHISYFSCNSYNTYKLHAYHLISHPRMTHNNHTYTQTYIKYTCEELLTVVSWQFELSSAPVRDHDSYHQLLIKVIIVRLLTTKCFYTNMNVFMHEWLDL